MATKHAPSPPPTTHPTSPVPSCVFLGLENGDECFCRNNKKYRRLGKIKNRNCKMECPGDSTETCGGASALEVFKIKDLDEDAGLDGADLEETDDSLDDDLDETDDSSSVVDDDDDDDDDSTSFQG